MQSSETNIRKKVIDLTATLALQATAQSGEDYKTAISKSLDEACKRLGVTHRSFISMFRK